MTQLFGEDGKVDRVTVIEAGPCHVTAIRTEERDGYAAVQLGFGETKEKALTKGELGHLKKADAPALRHLAEFRGEAGELKVGDTVTVDELREGPDHQGRRHLEGQGLPGHRQAPQLLAAARSRTARTTCARRARSAPPPRPRACSRASAGPGQMGNKRVTQRGLEIVDVIADKNLLLVRGSVPGPRGGTIEIRSDVRHG